MPNVAMSSKNVTHASAANAANPGNTALSSPEQMYSPILVVKSGGAAGGGVSSFEQPVANYTSDGQYASQHLGPTRSELDPYFSNFTGDPDSWIGSSDFQFMSNNGSGPNGADTNIGKVDRSTISQVAVNHFRGPMCISGIGTDLADRPYPAVSSTGEDSWKLNPEAVNDRSTWPAGPLDVKWDEERKVWSGGPQFLMGFAERVPRGSLCSPSSFTVNVFRLEAGRGNGLSNLLFGETVTVFNFDESLEEQGTSGNQRADEKKKIFVICARINYIWVPIWVGCPQECGVGRFVAPCQEEDCTGPPGGPTDDEE